MKKPVFSILATTLIIVALALAACESGGSQPEPSATPADPDEAALESEDVPEAESPQPQVVDVLPNAPAAANDRGLRMISDQDHFYYAIGGSSIYQTDISFGSPTKADDRGYYGLCEVDGVVYYNTSERDTETSGFQLRAYDQAQQSISVADTFSYLSERLSPMPYGDGIVYYDGNDIDFLSANGRSQGYSLDGPFGLSGFGAYQITTDGNLVYFIGSYDDEGVNSIYSFDPEDPSGSVKHVADAGSAALAVNDAGVFFLAEPNAASSEGDSAPAGDSGNEVLELMLADAQGNVTATGVTGVFEERIFTYGNYVFYTRHDALAGESGEDSEWRPCAYDTATNKEYVIDRPEYSGLDLVAMDASGGYLLLESYRDSDYLLSSLTQVDGARRFWDLVKDPEKSQALLNLESDEAAAQARAEEEARQAAADEPYGPGTSTLYLEAGENQSSCFKLVRLDGSVEFQILLSPGESQYQSFPSGRYTLRIAEGAKWISDEEAFGPDGSYSTTNVYTFEDGSTYEIGSGTYGNFSGDSQSGFAS